MIAGNGGKRGRDLRRNDGGDGAVIYSVAVSYGRNEVWNGAVDGLRINDTIYDFEEYGVIERPAV